MDKEPTAQDYIKRIQAEWPQERYPNITRRTTPSGYHIWENGAVKIAELVERRTRIRPNEPPGYLFMFYLLPNKDNPAQPSEATSP